MEGGSNEGRLILVSGYTGQQGGSVARSLLKRGFGVRALTRDPDKSAPDEWVGREVDIAGDEMTCPR